MENKKMEKLLCDESFLKRLVEAKTIDEVKSIFKEENQEITDDQIEELRKIFSQIAKMNLNDGLKKMHESELEDISGGISDTERMISAGILGSIGAFVGTTLGMGKSIYDLALYESKQDLKKRNDTQDSKEIAKFFLKIGVGAVSGAVLGGTAGYLIN